MYAPAPVREKCGERESYCQIDSGDPNKYINVKVIYSIVLRKISCGRKTTKCDVKIGLQ